MSIHINRLGIVGAGTMGAGIMINAAMSGLDVVLLDRDADTLDRAQGKLSRYLDRQVAKERIATDAAAAVRARVTTETDMSALADCDLVIEAVFENLPLKKAIFADLERVVRADTILASNTSCLRLSDIAADLADAGRFCGMHYFSPAEINPVVELIQGPETRDDCLRAADAFLTRTGKTVIACKDQNGFALNRFFCPYTNEAVHVLDQGLASTAQIDAIARDRLGLALGPFAVMNIIGTATNLNAVRNLGALGPFYEAAAGLIAHGTDNTPWQIDEDPAPLDPQTADQIGERLENAILLPVVEELAEGTATLDAIDTGARMAFRLGLTPGEMLKRLGPEGVSKRLGDFATAYGHPAPAPVV